MKMRNGICVASSVVFCTMLVGAATSLRAAPAQWTGAGANNHYYEFVLSPDISWNAAKLGAQSHSFNGAPGMLASITSAAENAFLASTFPERGGSDQNAWLGGYQDLAAPDYAEPAGGWRWISGEPWSYTNWFTTGPVEPDNFGGSQGFLRSNVNWQWDDVQEQPANPSIQTISGYMIEYVPEPSTLGLATGAGLLLMRRRMR